MNRRIIDYIILRGEQPSENLFDRIHTQIAKIERKIEISQNNIDFRSKRLERYRLLNDQFNKFREFQEGKEYKVLTREEFESWNHMVNQEEFSDFERSKYNKLPAYRRFSHPLWIHGKINDTLVFGEPEDLDEKRSFAEFKTSCKIIDEELDREEKIFKKEMDNIEALSKSLEYYRENQDPTVNDVLKPKLELEVLELIRRGYEPLGGVSVSSGYASQAMVKYSEE